MAVTAEAVIERLKRVRGPDLQSDIVSLGLVSDIHVDGGKVMFSITVDASRAEELEPLRQAAEKIVSDMEGVEHAVVVMTAERAGTARSGASPAAPVRPAPRPDQAADLPPPVAARAAGPRSAAAAKPGVPGVKAIIAVASGKGGVGKSTTAVNLALGLRRLGLSVGMLDADIYGPSIPRLLRITGRPQPVSGRVLRPMEGYGLKVMSMGFLVDEETPMIWRGPMVISALTQMLREVAWGDLDVMVVDMPPGTGDAQLTMAQQVPLAGAVIVSTPQDLALIDARKGINMFRKVDVPILGIVENMSTFVCPHCGGRSDIFGHGGAREEAMRLGVPFLGEVPLTMAIRARSDGGEPIVVSEPEDPAARTYVEVAARVREELARRAAAGRPAPRIVIES